MKKVFKSIIKNSLILSLLAMILFNLTPIFAQMSTQNVNRNHLCDKRNGSGKVADGSCIEIPLSLNIIDSANISKTKHEKLSIFKWGVEISEGNITKGEYFETVPIAYGSTSPTVYERSITLDFDLSLIVGVAKWVQIAIGANASYTKTVNLEANLPSSVEGKGPGDIYNVRYYKIYRDVTLTRYYKNDGKKINGEKKVVKWMGYMQYPDESFWSK